MPQPILENNPHPSRSELSSLAETSVHVKAFKMAELIRQLTPDPSYNLQPNGLVVGSFVLDPDGARDLDFEVRGVSWDHLQEQFQMLEGTNGIAKVGLTEVNEDLSINKETGNAFVAVWLTMDDGSKMNISIPMTVGPETTRYSQAHVSLDPELPLEKASRRRSFAHKALAYDPLAGERGQILDPHNGRVRTLKGELTILQPEAFASDPLGLYSAIQEIAAENMEPDQQSRDTLCSMSEMELPSEDTDAFTKNRFTYEVARLLEGEIKPSTMLSIASELGALRRDVPELGTFLLAVDDETKNTLMTEVDAAWTTTRNEQGWSETDKLSFVLARLGHTVETLSDGEISAYAVAERFYHSRGARMSVEDLTVSTERFIAAL